MSNNPYLKHAVLYAELFHAGKRLPLGDIPLPTPPTLIPESFKALVFSPHPDDECIIGGMALRLLREEKMSVVNVAVTQGSDRSRQTERWKELTSACDYLGFRLVRTAENGLERIQAATRTNDPIHWSNAIQVIADLLNEYNPRVIFFPHATDWNSTHIGVHHLVMDALGRMSNSFTCTLVETEYWGAMDTPNLMVELSIEDVSILMAALSFHVKEVERNPYHLRLPAWLQDNVRRGGELVGGQGGAVPDFVFATLYRIRRWKEGAVHDVLGAGRQVSAQDRFGELLHGKDD